MATAISGAAKAEASPRSIVLPLALAQFICSYAATNMNVAISAIAGDLGTDVHGVQTTITLFTLTMAALMIPGSKLTDLWGRKFCFQLGLIVYGLGALLAAWAGTLGVLTLGYSLLQGIGTALLIPPVYILVTVSFADMKTRAKYFGVVSGAGGIGAATGPLIGGVITTALGWRTSFIVQVLVVAAIIVLGRRIVDPGVQGARPRFDFTGAILSAAGLVFVVLGILLSGTYGWFKANQDVVIGNTTLIPEGGISPVWISVAIGVILLAFFFWHIRADERAGKDPLLHPRMFQNRIANLGLVTQNVQWTIMQGTFFVTSVYLQTVRGNNAIQTGLLLTPATIGILLASALAERMASRRSQRGLILGGFAGAIVGLALILLLVSPTSGDLSLAPGLLVFGAGVGVMLTASVNVVQSSFPDSDQGEISGLSRSVSNLGSSFGTAFVGSLMVVPVLSEAQAYGVSVIALMLIASVGLIAALVVPRKARPVRAEPAATVGQAA